jgi:hypothetical protein
VAAHAASKTQAGTWILLQKLQEAMDLLAGGKLPVEEPVAGSSVRPLNPPSKTGRPETGRRIPSHKGGGKSGSMKSGSSKRRKK